MATPQSSTNDVRVMSAQDNQLASDPLPSPKLKGKQRLVAGLKRIGSSQSVFRLNRAQEQGYRGTGRGSISCISLTGSSSYHANNFWSNAYPTPLPSGFQTAPTSIPGTPAAGLQDLQEHRQVRAFTLGANSPTHLQTSHSSTPLPAELRPANRSRASTGVSVAEHDYFSRPITTAVSKQRPSRPNFNFWGMLPTEISMHVLQLLKPKEIVRCSAVSKAWHHMCFDGQLWARLDASEFYQDIPADALRKIIQRAGPFVRDLNLRGCVQLSDKWKAASLTTACENLENLSLEGCKIDRHSIHALLNANPNLIEINFSGLLGVTNSTMKVISHACKQVQVLNVSWCSNMDTKGLKRVVMSCPSLRDIRAGEIRGLDDKEFMLELFTRNSLERLMLQHCDSLSDEALEVLIEGQDAEIDYLTGRRIVQPRCLKHLDLGRCRNLTDTGMLSLKHNCPSLEGLRVSKIPGLTDTSLAAILPTMPRLTHLDLEEVEGITNHTLQELAKSPCMASLKHLSISYCESLGDSGMLPVIKAGLQLRSLELDNTRISNLVLIEAAAMVRQREPPARSASIDAATMNITKDQEKLQGRPRPSVGLKMVVFDCQNVTWTGIREILSRNAEIRRPRAVAASSSPALMEHAKYVTSSSASSSDALVSPTTAVTSRMRSDLSMPAYPRAQDQPDGDSAVQPSGPTYPHHVIALKVFYGYQPTVLEHTRRVLRGDLAAAARLERKWAEYMLASEEAGAPGGFGIGGFGAAAFGIGGLANRRRRRRAHQAMMMHADEEDAGGFGPAGTAGAAAAIGRRRRARSGGGCTVM